MGLSAYKYSLNGDLMLNIGVICGTVILIRKKSDRSLKN